MTAQPAILTQFGLKVVQLEVACKAILSGAETTVNVLATATECLFDVTVEIDPEVSFEVIVTRANEKLAASPDNRKVTLREANEGTEPFPTLFDPIIAKIEGFIHPDDLHFQ